MSLLKENYLFHGICQRVAIGCGAFRFKIGRSIKRKLELASVHAFRFVPRPLSNFEEDKSSKTTIQISKYVWCIYRTGNRELAQESMSQEVILPSKQ